MSCPRKNSFCYICGLFVPNSSYKFRMCNEELNSAYRLYFGNEVFVDAWYAPDICCQSCRRILLGWKKGESYRSFPFSRPMTWRERPGGHDSVDCYFCSTISIGFTHQTRDRITYKFNAFAEATALREVGIEAPEPPKKKGKPNESESMEVDAGTADTEQQLEMPDIASTSAEQQLEMLDIASTSAGATASEFVPSKFHRAADPVPEKKMRPISQDEFNDISRLIK